MLGVVLAAAVVGALAGGGSCLADPAAAGRARAESYTFAFHDADVSQVAAAILGDALGVSYTVDPGVTGKISFRIDQRLTGAQLLEAFEAALETSNITLVRQGDSLVLEPRSKAKGAASLHTLGEGMHGADYEIVAAPLNYAAPSEVAKALQAVTSEDPVIYTDDKTGLLLLGGTGSELQSAVKFIHLLDQSGLQDSKIRFFELQSAVADTLAGDLQHILDAAHVGGVTVVPLRRLNGLFVFARTPEALDQISGWIMKLDVPSQDKGIALYIYHPKNLSAESLSATLNGVTETSDTRQAATDDVRTSAFAAPQGQAGPGAMPLAVSTAKAAESEPRQASPAASSDRTGSGGDFLSTDGDPVRVTVDKDINTLLISCSASRWVKIRNLLEEIDQAPAQVLIEASIVEVTLSSQLNTGVDWSRIADHGALSIGDINNGSSAVGASYPGLAVTYLTKNLDADISALATQSTVDVVSAPKIIALDNHTAKLEVGDQVPVVTQSSENTTAAGAPVINSVTYLDTGVILDVTPRISGEDRIYMDVSQEVSSVAQTTTSGIDSPTIQQRRLSTTLTLRDGGVVALGGLISTNHSVGSTGIPFVSDIPVLGNLFKSVQRSSGKTELIVLLTAKILRDDITAERVFADLLADMKEIKSRGLAKL